MHQVRPLKDRGGAAVFLSARVAPRGPRVRSDRRVHRTAHPRHRSVRLPFGGPDGQGGNGPARPGRGGHRAAGCDTLRRHGPHEATADQRGGPTRRRGACSGTSGGPPGPLGRGRGRARGLPRLTADDLPVRAGRAHAVAPAVPRARRVLRAATRRAATDAKSDADLRALGVAAVARALELPAYHVVAARDLIGRMQPATAEAARDRAHRHRPRRDRRRRPRRGGRRCTSGCSASSRSTASASRTRASRRCCSRRARPTSSCSARSAPTPPVGRFARDPRARPAPRRLPGRRHRRRRSRTCAPRARGSSTRRRDRARAARGSRSSTRGVRRRPGRARPGDARARPSGRSVSPRRGAFTEAADVPLGELALAHQLMRLSRISS